MFAICGCSVHSKNELRRNGWRQTDSLRTETAAISFRASREHKLIFLYLFACLFMCHCTALCITGHHQAYRHHHHHHRQQQQQQVLSDAMAQRLTEAAASINPEQIATQLFTRARTFFLEIKAKIAYVFTSMHIIQLRTITKSNLRNAETQPLSEFIR